MAGVDDDFSTNTLPDYTVISVANGSGTALVVSSGALQISGTTAGTRQAMHKNWLNGDAGYVAFTLNAAATTKFSSVVWSMDDAQQNYYGFHIVSGKLYVFKNIAGTPADISVAGGITMTWASGDRAWARFNNDTIEVFQNNTVKFSTITGTGVNGTVTRNVPHGIGHRRVGLRIEYVSGASVACTRFEASDLLAPGNAWDIPDITPGRFVGRQIAAQRASIY